MYKQLSGQEYTLSVGTKLLAEDDQDSDEDENIESALARYF